MECSFDGVRSRLVDDFNELTVGLNDNRIPLTGYELSRLDNIRHGIITLICMYDDTDKDDCNEIDKEVFELPAASRFEQFRDDRGI